MLHKYLTLSSHCSLTSHSPLSLQHRPKSHHRPSLARPHHRAAAHAPLSLRSIHRPKPRRDHRPCSHRLQNTHLPLSSALYDHRPTLSHALFPSGQHIAGNQSQIGFSSFTCKRPPPRHMQQLKPTPTANTHQHSTAAAHHTAERSSSARVHAAAEPPPRCQLAVPRCSLCRPCAPSRRRHVCRCLPARSRSPEPFR